MSVTKELIVVKDLHKNFGDLEVLKGIDQTIHQGEVVSIIGPSGSGKSTFLRCLNLLEKPTSGQIILKGWISQLKMWILIHTVKRLG